MTRVSQPATGVAPPAQPTGAVVSPAATATTAMAPQQIEATVPLDAAATDTLVLTATAVQGQAATATQPPATEAQEVTATVVVAETRTGGPTEGGVSLWRNPLLYIVPGVVGALVLALLFSPGLRGALIDRVQSTPPAELVLWGSILFIVILLASTGSFLFRNPAPAPTEEIEGSNVGTEVPAGGLLAGSPVPTVSSLPEEILPPTPTPWPTLPPLELPEVTPPAGGQVIVVTPAPNSVGWVRQGDEDANHFGDYNIYAGIFKGQVHIGAIRFDLTEVPAGAPIHYADLTLTGLSDQWLGSEGIWRMELLKPWMGTDWTQRRFDTLERPDGAALELTPTLSVGDLATGRANTWVLGPGALETLEARTYSGRVSFRIRGPDTETDDLSTGPLRQAQDDTLTSSRGASGGGSGQSLFTWDSGYGTGSRGRGPVLRLVVGAAPETPPPSPTPAYTIITPVPPTETPGNVVTLAARLMTATAEATPYVGTGTPTPPPSATPLPPDWVTPVVVAPTARPENVATAQWHALVATAEAFVYGTPTPTPPNVWTVTPTSPPALLIDLADLTPTPNPTPTPQVTPTPARVPSVLRGRIAFRSDRLLDDNWILVMNSDGRDLKLLTNPWAYHFERDRQARSPDGAQQAIVETVNNVPHIFRLSLVDGLSADLPARGAQAGAQAGTRRPLASDQLSYDPVWSPNGDWIAYVGQAPDGNEEIYLVRPDGTEKTRLTFTPEAYEKQPTWSPDGARIAFVSNRDTGHAQIWVMNADGSGAVNVSRNEFSETDPIWLK